MSTENKGFDFDGCHKHRAEQSARIAGMYSNGEEIFQKAKKEGEALKAKADKAKKDDEDEDDDDDTDEGDDDIDDTDNEDLDERSKVEKAAYQTLGVAYESILEKSKGEGSKGGKVIGHTKSGKPIYENHKADSEIYGKGGEKYNYQSDHIDAANKHKELAKKHLDDHSKHWENGDHEKSDRSYEKFEKHNDIRRSHYSKSMEEFKHNTRGLSNEDKINEANEAFGEGNYDKHDFVKDDKKDDSYLRQYALNEHNR